MPLYRYRRADGSVFEVTEPVGRKLLRVDPVTGQAVQRVSFAPTGRSKGNGPFVAGQGRVRPIRPKGRRDPGHRRSGSR